MLPQMDASPTRVPAASDPVLSMGTNPQGLQATSTSAISVEASQEITNNYGKAKPTMEQHGPYSMPTKDKRADPAFQKQTEEEEAKSIWELKLILLHQQK